MARRAPQPHRVRARPPPPALLRRTDELGPVLTDDRNLSQLCYAHLAGQALGWRWRPSGELLRRAQAAQRRIATQTSVSALHKSVFGALREMGWAPQLEALTADGCLSIDIALPAAEGRAGIAVEVDGPSHFTSTGAKTANTRLRDFLLGQLGWRVVALPYFELDEASASGRLPEYLAARLR